ncbi:hypothetical protein [Proteus penneri]|uniref:hypothetical protein n=3 Tax=Morganellaceae TaxID=1903414 RepID=UPI0034D3EC03
MVLPLSPEWVPGSSYTYAWVAMDNQGYLAKMYNNNSGWLPEVLLSIPDIKLYLDDLSEYIDGESEKYNNKINKNANYIVDLYSSYTYRKYDKSKIIKEFDFELKKWNGDHCDAGIGAKMGMFLFEALNELYEDHPVGYEGKTKMGDYFRFIVPTIYATIEDIPEELRKYIVVSDSLDFTKDRLLDNNKISDYFTRMYSE